MFHFSLNAAHSSFLSCQINVPSSLSFLLLARLPPWDTVCVCVCVCALCVRVLLYGVTSKPPFSLLCVSIFLILALISQAEFQILFINFLVLIYCLLLPPSPRLTRLGIQTGAGREEHFCLLFCLRGWTHLRLVDPEKFYFCLFVSCVQTLSLSCRFICFGL